MNDEAGTAQPGRPGWARWPHRVAGAAMRLMLRRKTPPPPGVVERLTGRPLDPDLHLELAREAAQDGRPYLAYAALRSAAFLGASPVRVAEQEPAILAALPDNRYMKHNQFFRFASLAAEVTSRGGAGTSVLDVGGGHGELAAFLPRATQYCLAEPRVNGISGALLPFAGQSFDFVVACHVLEHIAAGERATFLDQLLACARRGVILLNPFNVPGTYPEDRLRLVIDVTDANWAKEHLACTLPGIDEVQQYASRRGLQFEMKPNGTLTTSLAFVFIDHFAARCGDEAQWRHVNAFFNERYTPIMDSPDFPAAYMIYLGRPPQDTAVDAPGAG
jgi:SAM-dependent methyltransferase